MPCCAQFYAVLGTKISCRASALLTQAQPKEPEGCKPLGVVFRVRRLPGPSLLHSDHSFLFYEEGKRRERGCCRGPSSSAFSTQPPFHVSWLQSLPPPLDNVFCSPRLLDMYLKNVRPSYLHVLCGEDSGVHHHAQYTWCWGSNPEFFPC